jgi:hypothetical protein
MILQICGLWIRSMRDRTFSSECVWVDSESNADGYDSGYDFYTDKDPTK